jgi:hypothetical protein
MRSRVLAILLVLSLGINAFLTWERLQSKPSQTVLRRELPPTRTLTTNILRPIRTNIIVRPQFLTWRDIESDDYTTYVQNLRAIGCPEQTIRDIIVADVNELFAHRRATELFNPTHEWWRSQPDPKRIAEAAAQRHALETERRALLTRLLGPGWELSGSLLTEYPDSQTTLDGPLLGDLPLETKHAVRQIELDAKNREQAYLEEATEQGVPPDPAKLAQLRKETRDELARILSPQQLEEYLLRYSDTAGKLRGALKDFDPSPDEFRQLFRAADAIDQELASIASATDPVNIRRRQELENLREAKIAETLGPDRYRLYKLNQDPLFQRAKETALKLGAPPEAAVTLYNIDRETELERRRILADNSLTPDEQALHLTQTDKERLNSIRKVLGEEAFRKLQTEGPP